LPLIILGISTVTGLVGLNCGQVERDKQVKSWLVLKLIPTHSLPLSNLPKGRTEAACFVLELWKVVSSWKDYYKQLCVTFLF